FDKEDPSHAAFLAGLFPAGEAPPFDIRTTPLGGLAVSLGIIAYAAGPDALGGTGFIVDSAATFTMTDDDLLLFDFQLFGTPIPISGAFGSKGAALGWGKLKYGKEDEEGVIVDKVLYVPTLGVNLLSSRQLMTTGHTFTNDTKELSWFDASGSLVVKCPIGPNLIRVPARSLSSIDLSVHALTTAPTGASNLVWHRRMGHPEPSRADRTVKLVDGADGAKGLGRKFQCVACEMGKAHRHHNYNPRPRETTIGATLWTDGWGPSRVQGRNGERYLLGILDDATAKLWVIGLKDKTEAGNAVLKLLRQIERQYDTKIKRVHSDNGTGYRTSRRLLVYFEESGIVRTFNQPGAHEQNRIEGYWRTLFNMVRTMMFEAGLPPSFWSEASYCAAHVLNRLATKALKENVPEGAARGEKIDISYLKPFGCFTILTEGEAKLARSDKTGVNGVPARFVGYDEEGPPGTGGRFYNLLT
ncbi:putative transposase, partial [Phenoliferia sp. Uapishka_3]